MKSTTIPKQFIYCTYCIVSCGGHNKKYFFPFLSFQFVYMFYKLIFSVQTSLPPLPLSLLTPHHHFSSSISDSLFTSVTAVFVLSERWEGKKTNRRNTVMLLIHCIPQCVNQTTGYAGTQIINKQMWGSWKLHIKTILSLELKKNLHCVDSPYLGMWK